MFLLDVACACHTGKIRSNNEDNLYFDGKILEEIHSGLGKGIAKSILLSESSAFAVFDGMGGEESGEKASYEAAARFAEVLKDKQDFLVRPRDLLNDVCLQMNGAVLQASEKLPFGRMGSTVVSLLFSRDEVHVCNLGDSRAFRLRDKELMQLTQDHVEMLPAYADGQKRKPALSQYLGVRPEELTLEPYIAKGELRSGDQYLLCSDGLTDMVRNVEICSILEREDNTLDCVDALVRAALQGGGKDNITVILCRVR